MLVCHCKAVHEARVRAVIDAGASDEFDVAEACGAGSDCGGCVPTITSLLDEVAAPCGGGALTACEMRVALRPADVETVRSAS
jgi:bacterioferritin-associated ferredoxin